MPAAATVIHHRMTPHLAGSRDDHLLVADSRATDADCVPEGLVSFDGKMTSRAGSRRWRRGKVANGSLTV
jgi:hypothetical protein